MSDNEIKVYFSDEAQVYTGHGSIMRLVVWPGNNEGKIVVHHLTVKPNESLKGHSHEFADDVINVIKGEGVIKTTGGKEIPIRKGASVIVPPGAHHEVCNTSSDEELEIIGVLTPPDVEFYKKAGLL
ncbi:MAG: cupin domain-containing protein [Bacillota bacterium]|nr:cupin domain-containing protein [Bacillota bacterium]